MASSSAPDPPTTPNLKSLRLDVNQLSGPIPAELARLTNLQRLHFDSNSGLCAPLDDAFQAWLQRIPDRSGDNCVPPAAVSRASSFSTYEALTSGAYYVPIEGTTSTGTYTLTISAP